MKITDEREWKPIETAPKDERILVLYTTLGNHIEDCIIKDDAFMLFDGDNISARPTHWIPLPEPPK